MKREEIRAIMADGITDEQLKSILDINSADIGKAKGEFADYDSINQQLKKAEDTIKNFGDVEGIKADVEKYKTEAETIKAAAAKQIAQLQCQGKVSEFLSGKKFVNDFTKEFIQNKLLAQLDNEETKGKNFEDIFKELTEGKENILAQDTTPPPYAGGTGTQALNTRYSPEVNSIRAAAGLKTE